MISESDVRNGCSAPDPGEPAAIPDLPKSGYVGVSYHERTGRWLAQAKVDGVLRSFGLFDDPEAAAKGRASGLEAANRVGFVAEPKATARPLSPPPAPAPAPAKSPIASASEEIRPMTSESRTATKAQETPSATSDPEVEAIAAIARTLAGLDPEAVSRVLEWASSRFARRAS